MSHSHFDYNGPTKSDPGLNEVGIIVYGYWPSASFPIVAMVFFAMTLVAQTYYAIRKPRLYRTFHILLAIGSVRTPHSRFSWGMGGIADPVPADGDWRIRNETFLALPPVQPRRLYRQLLHDRHGERSGTEVHSEHIMLTGSGAGHLYRRRRLYPQHAGRGFRQGDTKHPRPPATMGHHHLHQYRRLER